MYMARSKRSSRKIMKGGEWYNPSTWSWTIFNTEKKTDTVVNNEQKPNPDVNTSPTSNEQTSAQPEELRPAEVTQKVDQKPWYQFWGGKTKRSKSKGRKTKKTLK